MFPQRCTAVALAAACLAAACGSGAPNYGSTEGAGASPASSEVTQPYKAQWTDTTCLVERQTSLEMTCGTLTVPEDRTEPAGAKVTIPVMRIRSSAANPEPDPVVYLHGGPGGAAITADPTYGSEAIVLERRDLILFDQRGSGGSDPSLECPDRADALLRVLSATAEFPAELALMDEALASCYRRLVDRGIDLDQYNTRTNAADLADLRVALGLEEWNLWGASYGARLALETMRSYPEGIRSVVLDSVYSPTAGDTAATVRSGTAAFAALSEGCAADANCSSRFPDVAGDIATTQRALDATPFQVPFTSADGSVNMLHTTGSDAIGGLFNAMYDTDLISRLPAVIHGLADGNRDIVSAMVDSSLPSILEENTGAYLSYECADNGAKSDPKMVTKLRKDPGQFGLVLISAWSLFCAEWPVEPLDASFSRSVTSDIPALVLAGEYDPVTPAADSRAVADKLTDSVFVEVPRGGHGVITTSLCTSGIFGRFLDEGTTVDSSCVAGIVPQAFG